jgi:hypothetical protein
MKHKIKTAAFLLGVVGASVVRGDTLILENHRELTGEVTKSDSEYIVKLKSGIVTRIAIEDVVRWDKDDAPAAPAGGGAPAPAASPAPAMEPVQLRPKMDPRIVLAKSSQSLGLGLNAFKAGDPVAAYENFLDSYQVLKSNGVPIDPNNPLHYTLLACLGASCVANQDFPHAALYLSAASASKLHDPSVPLNQDIVDYVQHVNALRVVKNLTGEVYIHLRNALQMSHPGKKQWGGRWLPREEANQLEMLFKAEVARWKLSAAFVEIVFQHLFVATEVFDRRSKNVDFQFVAWNLVIFKYSQFRRKDAEANFAQAKSQALFGNSGGTGLAAAQSSMFRATNDYNAIKDEPPKLKKQIDWPEWPPFPPAKPDVTAAATALANGSSRFSVTRSAVAVPVAPDLVLTSSAAVADATDIQTADATGVTRTGRVVRKDTLLGLALVKLDGKPLDYLNLAQKVDGHQFACWAFPEVTVDKPVPEALPTSASAPRNATWAVFVSRHPRLPGAAVVDVSGLLVGIALGERASESSQVPAVPLDEVRSFLGSDMPATPGGRPDVTDILELRASH